MFLAQVSFNESILYFLPVSDPQIQNILALQAYQIQTTGKSAYSVKYYNCYEAKEADPMEAFLDSFPETDIDLPVLADNLRWLRKTRGITLRELAKRTGLSVSFLSSLELGKSEPSLTTLGKLVSAYKAPIAIHIGLKHLPISSLAGEPLDYDIDLGECTCGMGSGTIAGEEHAEGCPMYYAASPPPPCPG